MSNISYKFNLTLSNGTVVKIYDITETSKEILKITALVSDYKKAEISSIFAENDLSEIIETSKNAVFIRRYSNYVGTPSIYEGSITVSVDKITQVNTTKEVTDESTGEVTTEPTVIDVIDAEEIPVDVIFIEIPYVSPTDQRIAEMEAIINPKIDVETCTLEELQAFTQKANKAKLAQFLSDNPLVWTDGEKYGVTQEDQIEMDMDLDSYSLMIEEDPSWKLEWHNTKKACREFTVDEYKSLLRAIIQYVYPYRRMQETYKQKIYDATTKEDVLNIDIVYSAE